MMHELLNTKIQMHIALCNDEGISERDLFETKEDPATTAYLSCLENVGNSGDFIDMMAVLSPSFLGYAEIGAYLGAKKNAPDYQKWINAYAGKNNQTLCLNIGTMIDNAINSRLGADAMSSPRWQTLCERFCTIAKLEVDFFEMGLSG